MSLYDFVIAALAVWQAVEIWHHGSLFEDTRAWLETKQDSWFWPASFVSRLMLCPFCLSVWTAAAVCCNQLYGLPLLNTILAASRLANLFNDATRWFCRTPNRHLF